MMAVFHFITAGRSRSMQRFRNILVGLDLSNADRLAGVELTPPNAEALRRAIWLAAHTRGTLTIFSVLDLSAHAQALLEQDPHHDPAALDRAVAELLERFVEQARAEGVQARLKLSVGQPWQEICREVCAEKQDLVVVGTRDLGAAGRVLYGSTAMKLLRNCPCPVWVTRPDPNWDDLNILVPSDLSDVSLEALRIAVNGGQLVDTRIHLLHALEGQVAPPNWFGSVQKRMVADYLVGLRSDTEKKLNEQLLLTDYRTTKYGVQIHIVEGPADEAILKAIDDYQIDLVVMGTSARSGLTGWVIGNTAERLISHMKCSVIAVKPAGFVSPIAPDEPR
jgi:universal stress protein E